MSLLLVLSLAPVIALAIYIYIKDKFEKEPLGLLLKCLLGGVGVAASVLILFNCLRQIGISIDLIPWMQSLLGAALPEELLKFLFLIWIVWKNRNFNEFFDGIVYSTFLSLGFAGVENVLYVANGGIGVAISRAIFAVPAHFFFAVVMGYYLSMAKFRKQNKLWFGFLAIAVPVLLHFLYDFFLMESDYYSSIDPSYATSLMFAFYLFDILLWRIAMKRIHKRCQGCGAPIAKGQHYCSNCLPNP